MYSFLRIVPDYPTTIYKPLLPHHTLILYRMPINSGIIYRLHCFSCFSELILQEDVSTSPYHGYAKLDCLENPLI